MLDPACEIEDAITDWIGDDLDKAPIMPEGLVEVFGQSHGGAPMHHRFKDYVPPPDCLAFYLPFHYYFPTWWGVYILADGVQWLKREIVTRSNGRVSNHDATQAARLFLYYHEAFHHKTECLATRFELSHRMPCFKVGFEQFYQKTFNTDACLEEGLAQAFALQNVMDKLKDREIAAALAAYIGDCPPGYRRGVEIRRKLDEFRCQFAEENRSICFKQAKAKNSDIWRTAPHMFDGIANIKARVNYVVPERSSLAKRFRFKPLLTPNRLIKKLEELANLTFVRHGRGHDIYALPNGKRIPIPRHARDLGEGLVRSILREAGLPMGIDEFMRT